jgi:hypothetical protein
MDEDVAADSDREGWLLWLGQLEAQRAQLRAALGDDPRT